MYRYTMSLSNGKPVFEDLIEGFNYEIRKGDKFICTKDVVMEGDKHDCAYTKDKVYTSEHDGRITNNWAEKNHWWNSENWSEHFQRYEERDRDYFDSVREEYSMPPLNPVNPPHYKGSIECIDVIEEVTKDLEGFEALLTGTIIKYLYRWKRKNGVEDLEKAQVYLNWLKEHVDNK